MYIISAYVHDKLQEEENDCYLKLQYVIYTKYQDEIIFLGDFNAKIGNDVIPKVKNRFNEETLMNSC